ncbi:hypothetical protein O181_074251 [Austropuccinia psidii MF-1]|uniref:SNF2 N-terminal domain-containing protein n=1 Tax=Austropuccinia psidii MF-1 TaxID=1389203 RepID=A0A9Q3I920_9BASI|nr:hypothetical protein [Austropuccinia psidii MF-1]
MPPSSPALFSLTSKQKLIQLHSGSDLPMIQTPLLPHQKNRLAFLWDGEIPNGKSACNLWATSPLESTFNARHIITKKVVHSFESLSTNTPLGGLLVDDMGLGKIIQVIALIVISKEQLITNPQCSRPTIIICPTCNQKYPSILRLQHCKPKSTVAPLVTHYPRPTSYNVISLSLLTIISPKDLNKPIPL